MTRTQRRRRARYLSIASIAVLIAAMVAISEAPAVPDESSPAYEVTANVDGDIVPVTVGTVLAVGEMVDGLCRFDREVGVHITVTEGDIAPAVTWTLDEECRMVVVSIVEAGAQDPSPEEAGR